MCWTQHIHYALCIIIVEQINRALLTAWSKMQQLVGLRGNKYTHTNKTFQITPTQKKKENKNKTKQNRANMASWEEKNIWSVHDPEVKMRWSDFEYETTLNHRQQVVQLNCCTGSTILVFKGDRSWHLPHEQLMQLSQITGKQETGQIRIYC